MHTNIKFRYDINALRAVAVTGVLLFHYKAPFFSGGFAGVDVFFVISGYLMSRIIISALNQKSFSIVGFYSKRLKRIVPALLVLIFTLTVVGFFIYFPDDYQLNEKNALTSVLFISNIFYWLNSGYFAESSDTNILLHTWSLSVEWQFYLLYPILLILMSKLTTNSRRYLVFFVFALVVFFVVSMYCTSQNAEGGFYLLPARAWEMLLGGVAFLCEGFAKQIRGRRLITITGYVTICVAFLFLRNDMMWPGPFTTIPVLATFLVIVSGYNDLKILRYSGVQFIGRISYSLYLWHWPVYVIAGYMGVQFDLIAVSVITLISCALGYLSFKYVELNEFKSSRILTMMCICAGCVAILSFTNTNHIVFKPKALFLADYKKNHSENTRKRLNSDACPIPAGCLHVTPDVRNILLIGDSHAAHISGPLKEALAKRNINLLKAAGPACRPILSKQAQGTCKAAINYIYNDFIARNSDKLDGVMISINWVAINDQTKFITDLKNTIGYLKQKKIPVILIGQNETYGLNYPTLKAKEIQYGMKLAERYLDRNCYGVNDLLKKEFMPIYLEIINNTIFPSLSADNAPYMIDENHFTEYGARLAVKKILADPIVVRLLK